MEKENTTLIETLLEIPSGFNVKDRHFDLYHPTLGKILYQQIFTERLELDEAKIKDNPFAEFIKAAKEHKEECCWIIAINTCETKKQVFANSLFGRVKFFMNNLDIEDIASMLITLFLSDKTEDIKKEYGIDKEHERLKRAMRAKQSENTFTFGGKSLYGSLVWQIASETGWTMDYILWGVSYVNLKLLLEDKVTSLHLTDEEKAKAGTAVIDKSNIIRADDPANMERIRAMDWR